MYLFSEMSEKCDFFFSQESKCLIFHNQTVSVVDSKYLIKGKMIKGMVSTLFFTKCNIKIYIFNCTSITIQS